MLISRHSLSDVNDVLDRVAQTVRTSVTETVDVRLKLLGHGNNEINMGANEQDGRRTGTLLLFP